MTRWEIPWTPAQVAALAEYQQAGRMHPYTCRVTSSHLPLIPTEGGWYCKGSGRPRDWCEYTQNWAHALPVTLKHELIAAGLVSHPIYLDGEVYPSIKLHTEEDAAEIAIGVFVKHLARLAMEEQAKGCADYLAQLAQQFADLL